MSILSFFKKKEELTLLVDIGNGSISCALVLFSKSKPPCFIYSKSSPLAITLRPDALRLSSSVCTMLDSVVASTVKKSKNLSTIAVSFSTPWFMLESKDVHIENNIPFIVSSSFINDVISREEDVIQIIIDKKAIKSSDVVETLNVTRQQAHALLSSLVNKGLLHKFGSTKSSYYKLSAKN